MRCQNCKTPVTSAWHVDPITRQLPCPRCGTRNADPYASVKWIWPVAGRKWHARRTVRIAIAAAVVTLLACVLLPFFRTQSPPGPQVAAGGQRMAAPSDTRLPLDAEVPRQQPDDQVATDQEAGKPDVADGGIEKEPAAEDEPNDAEKDGGSENAESDTSPPTGDGESQEMDGQPEADAKESDNDASSEDPGSSETGDEGVAAGGDGSTGAEGAGEPGPRFQIPNIIFANQRPVRCLAVSPDRTTLAFGLEGGTIRFWRPREAAGGETSIPCGEETPVSLAFHPAGQVLGALFAKRMVLFDVATREKIVTVESTARLASLAFSADGKFLAAAEEQGGVVVRRLPDLSVVQRPPGYRGTLAVTWCSGVERFAVASADNLVRLWTPLGAETPGRLIGHSDWVSSMTGIAGTNVLVTGSWDNTVRLWDLETREADVELRGHTSKITAVAATDDGRVLVSGDETGLVKIWAADTGTEITTFRGHRGRITGLAMISDSWLVSASGDGSSRAWNVTNGLRDLVSDLREMGSSVDRGDDSARVLAQRYEQCMDAANQHIKEQKWEEAAGCLREACALRPRYAEPLLCLGECLEKLNRPDEAIDVFRRAVQLQPDSGWANLRLGNQLAAAQRHDEAASVLRVACQQLPDFSTARILLGKVLIANHRYEEAIQELNEAAALAPRAPEPHHGLGLAYAGLLRWEKSIEELKRTIDVDRMAAEAYSDLIDVLLAYDQARAAEAAEWARLATQLGLSLRPGTVEKLNKALAASSSPGT